MEQKGNRDRVSRRSLAASSEALGLLVVAILLVLLLVIRWGGDIAWSAR